MHLKSLIVLLALVAVVCAEDHVRQKRTILLKKALLAKKVILAKKALLAGGAIALVGSKAGGFGGGIQSGFNGGIHSGFNGIHDTVNRGIGGIHNGIAGIKNGFGFGPSYAVSGSYAGSHNGYNQGSWSNGYQQQPNYRQGGYPHQQYGPPGYSAPSATYPRPNVQPITIYYQRPPVSNYQYQPSVEYGQPPVTYDQQLPSHNNVVGFNTGSQGSYASGVSYSNQASGTSYASGYDYSRPQQSWNGGHA